MTRILHVALQEYRRHVFTKRFLMGLLSVPLIVLVMVGLVFLIISMENNTTPLGYVDHSGLLANPLPAPAPEPPGKPAPMLAFADEAAARSALEAGQIQGYYVIPADYLSSGKVELVYVEPVKTAARQQFYDFLTVNLLRDTEPAVAARLLEGGEITVVSADGSRSASDKTWFNSLLPMMAGLAFMIVMFTTGGYLMQAVVEEKENRTMEVIVTSVSPDQFMAGKIIGDLAIGLTQVTLWGLFIVLTVLVGSNYAEFLRGVQVSSQAVLLLGVVMFPSIVMVAALMAAVGATVTEAREGQQVTGIIAMPVWIPYMLMALLIQNPNSPVAVALSLFPLTAPLTMFIRVGMTILPAWQIALSAVIQFASAAAAIWLAGRALRLGMLRYGKRLKWREIFVKS
ncbi:MAG: ABC-2 type transport system permease protein [Anaerolineaceae bacterium]|nr:MAG: ABC-2 type transport system permease protein [Anaerolineaceae bacterium]